MRTLDIPHFVQRIRQAGVWDHFMEFVDGDQWTRLQADASSAVAHAPTALQGEVTLSSAATDNNECSLRSTASAFKFLPDQPIIALARIQYTEVTGNGANVAFGLSSSFAANLVLDNGTGLAASFSGALIYKTDGNTKWKCRSQIAGTTSGDTESDQTAGGSAYHTLGVLVMPRSSVEIDVAFLCDPQGGANVKPLVDSRGNVIKHTVTLGTAANMYVGLYEKTGAAADLVTRIDFMGAEQVIM